VQGEEGAPRWLIRSNTATEKMKNEMMEMEESEEYYTITITLFLFYGLSRLLVTRRNHR
jgi:hypothetical protein